MLLPTNPVPPVGGEIRGIVGDTIYSRNPYGPYSYTYVPRVDPNTPQQQQIRVWFGTAAEVWKHFPPANRTGWNNYARNVPAQNSLGLTYYPTGYNRFVGTYVVATQLYVPISSTGPDTFTLGRLGQPTYTPYLSAYLLVTFDPTDDWLHTWDAGFILYTSRPQPPTVNYFTGPFRCAGAIQGGLPGPPYQHLFNPAFPAIPRPCKIFCRARCIESDSRLSPPLITSVYFA